MKVAAGVALVTGVASGPGLATVGALHGAGAKVVIVDVPSSAALAQHIVENPMLNGETIRLDGAIRMAAR